MVRLQIINLLPEEQGPHVLAQKLNHIQRIRKPWPISREPVDDHFLSAMLQTSSHLRRSPRPPPLLAGKDPEEGLTSQQVLAQLYTLMSLISETQPLSARPHLRRDLRHPGQRL